MVQNLYGQAKDYANGDVAEAIIKLVDQNPIGAILWAAAAGFALGLFMMRPAPRR